VDPILFAKQQLSENHPTVAWQWLGKIATAATIEEMLYVSLLCQGK
jgi:hypothetical protein